MRALQDLAHHRLRRIVGIDRAHVGAVDHDVGDFELVQVEQRAEAVAVLLDHRAVAVKVGDRAAQLLMRGALRRRANAARSRSRRAAGCEEASASAARRTMPARTPATIQPTGGHPGWFSFRKDSTSEAGTSLAMKAWPTPWVRMKVSAPRETFLSCAM